MNRNLKRIQKQIINIQKSYLHSYNSNQVAAAQLKWPTNEIRKTFLDYFCTKNKHKFIYSSSVVPRKGSGTYFTNAGMNQFKSIILGEVNSADIIDYNKYIGAANSQKCIRIGGKHSDLDSIGKDDTHHTFFEMLGNWSFGKYGKEDACRFALELLVDTYKLDMRRLYFTYFAGNDDLGLARDLETKKVWTSLGVPEANVLPFGMKDNFWEMDATGPCGPCTEIHYDRSGTGAAHLVNKGDERVLELWNLVFMQYNRLSQTSFITLPELVVDTGMGLERLSAVLNGLNGNYEIDLFTPIFKQIEVHLKSSGINLPSFHECDPSSQLKSGYRTVADHMRTICVSISDGLIPTRTGLGGYLRYLILKCMRICSDVFKVSNDQSAALLSSLVPVIVGTLGDAYPQLAIDHDRIQQVIKNADLQYKAKGKRSDELCRRFLTKLNNPKSLSGTEMWRLYKGDGSGEDVPIEFIENYAHSNSVKLDREGFDKLLLDDTEKSLSKLKSIRYENTQLIRVCSEMKRDYHVPITKDDFKYNFELDHVKHVARYKDGELIAKILCLIRVNEDETYEIVEHIEDGERCAIVLDHTNFYSEKGGQQSDSGVLHLIKDSASHVRVTSVQSMQDYTIHFGRYKSAPKKATRLNKNEYCNCDVDAKKRYSTTLSHTGVHVLNDSLRRYYNDENSVIQVASQAREHNLKFEFLFNKIAKFSKPTLEDIASIENQCQTVIDQELDVFESEIDFESAAVEGMRKLRDVLYPKRVRVVSVGRRGDDGEASFNELCCGTHVDNTRALRSFVITSISANGDISYAIDACVGTKAAEIEHNERIINDIYTEIAEMDASTMHGQHEIARKSIQIELLSQHWQLSYAFRHNLKKNLEKFRPSKQKLQKLLNEFFQDEILRDQAIDAEDLNMKFIHYNSTLPIETAIQALNQVENIPNSLLLFNKFRRYLIAYSYDDKELTKDHDRLFDLIEELLVEHKIGFDRKQISPNIAVFQFDKRTKSEIITEICKNIEKI